MQQKTRLVIVSVTVVALAGGLIAYAQQSGSGGSNGDAPEVEVNTENISYAIGHDIGARFDELDVQIDREQLAQGLRDQQRGNDGRLSHAQVRQVLEGFRQQLMEKQRQQQQQQQKQQQKQLKKNKEKGQAFLKQNKKKKAVKQTESGLQYKVIKSGEGKSPAKTDEVTVHYTGKLLDGTKFDSSRDRGRPATFPVNRVIKGWTEALTMMKPGAKWKLWIPSDLAYGDQGRGQNIGPGQTLVFTVELLDVTRNNNADTAQPSGSGAKAPATSGSQ